MKIANKHMLIASKMKGKLRAVGANQNQTEVVEDPILKTTNVLLNQMEFIMLQHKLSVSKVSSLTYLISSI